MVGGEVMLNQNFVLSQNFVARVLILVMSELLQLFQARFHGGFMLGTQMDHMIFSGIAPLMLPSYT